MKCDVFFYNCVKKQVAVATALFKEGFLLMVEDDDSDDDCDDGNASINIAGKQGGGFPGATGAKGMSRHEEEEDGQEDAEDGEGDGL